MRAKDLLFSYESRKGDKTVFTVDDDGALNGPQGGFLERLTKKK